MKEPIISQWIDYTKKQAAIECQLEALLKKKSQLSVSEYYALYQLNQQGRHMRMSDLQEHLHLSQSALSRLIQRLEDKEPMLVKRNICTDDKRGVYVDLTDAGLAELVAIQEEVEYLLKKEYL
ncbi:hypothetical protein BAU15_11595 [Enterococcus sp. JM4C]|uniref:MarR family winged helix-turn-helix transcriptional regulator n=1 Tax=Candidatus Enterococcus huntleyi TaxID=1857217 RepID=UPI0013796D2A|nr:MarR family transcriptional regulator [Enterococcus sp. JM4C]KAF1297386.1 hypothetical protein BAU15_11595 [Enterococcus sp. JM4C]